MPEFEPEFMPLFESLPLPCGALPVVLVDFFAGFFLLAGLDVELDVVPEVDAPEFVVPDCVPLLGVI